MRNFYGSVFFALLFCAPMLQAQTDRRDEKRNVKQPPKLIVLDDTQRKSSSPQDVLGQVYNLGQNNQLTPRKQSTDNLGFSQQEFQQRHQGIPVEFAISKLHSKQGIPQAVSGEYYPIKDLDVTTTLTNQQALMRAVNHIGAQHYLWEYPDAAAEMDGYQKPTGDLVILPMYNGDEISTYKLAYKFDIYATYPISRGDLYIDAKNGDALFYNATIKHANSFGHVGEPMVTVSQFENDTTYDNYTSIAMMASGTAATRYSGSRTIETQLTGGSYRLADTGRDVYTRDAKNQAPGGTYPYINNYDEFTDNDNNWTTAEHSANKDNAALDAHWGAMETYDYWQQVHGRDSYNGSGAQIRSYVHVDNNYDNAFWNGSVMSYGDGSSNGNEGNGFFDALTSIDVASHEIGHAVTTFTANLAYQRESGGLNEGFSDIWGAAVEHFAKGNGSDTNPTDEVWLIGDEIDRRSGSAALRSMSNPTSLGQPDTYGGQFWQNPNCGTPTQSNDYCGVHTNSGVLNYWFYLLVEGGNGTNDVGDVFSVSGIGMDKSAKIAYRTLNNYLSANSTFANARAGAIQAAKDLYGAGGAEEQAVTNAWHAVNVGDAFGGGNGGSNYCASNGNSVADEYISRVQLADINNTSGAGSGGYQNHTAVETDLAKGDAYTITITPTWTGTVYSEGYAVWIDYNHDGDFSDSGELVTSVAATQNTPVSGSFTVPTNASDGATRMRVSMKYNGVPSACESFSYGEVEDYTVNIGSSAADTQAPSVPTNLSASNITETTVDLSWNASNDNVGVTGYDVYQGTALLGTTANTSAQITGLSSGTNYTFNVRAKDDAGNVSGASNTVSVTTDSPASGGGCVNGISSFPYSEGYESNLGAWTQSTSDDINWTRDASGTPSSNTGPSSAVEGSFYVFVEASGNGTGYPNKQAILNSPCIDLSATAQPNFTFKYHMYGASDMGSLKVDVSDNDGATWTTLFSETGNKGNAWQSATVDLSAYNGSSIRLRFNRTTGSTWQADIAIDDVRVIDGTADICAGVAPYSSSQSYSTGDRVTYQGNLFERTASGWTNLGACGSSFGITNLVPQAPPVNSTFNIYPNPVKGASLQVDFVSQKEATFTIVNMLGQQVAKGNLSNTLEVGNLESGIYLLNATIDGQTITKRFIKE